MSDSSKNNAHGTGREQFVQQLLDSYFTFRRNLPEKGYLQENKTTQQIQDELLPMCSVSSDEIVSYMLARDYSPTTEQDGTVAWAVWRMI